MVNDHGPCRVQRRAAALGRSRTLAIAQHGYNASTSTVALSAGTRLGTDEITAPLGAGGMSEVYRATDTNVKRPVALKVLPASVAGDAERLARFQREAELLAALNHPHIAQIFGVATNGQLPQLWLRALDDSTARVVEGTQNAGMPFGCSRPT